MTDCLRLCPPHDLRRKMPLYLLGERREASHRQKMPVRQTPLGLVATHQARDRLLLGGRCPVCFLSSILTRIQSEHPLNLPSMMLQKIQGFIPASICAHSGCAKRRPKIIQAHLPSYKQGLCFACQRGQSAHKAKIFCLFTSIFHWEPAGSCYRPEARRVFEFAADGRLAMGVALDFPAASCKRSLCLLV